MVRMPPSALLLITGWGGVGDTEVSVMDCEPAAASWRLLTLRKVHCTHVYVCLRGVITKRAVREDICPPPPLLHYHTQSVTETP